MELLSQIGIFLFAAGAAVATLKILGARQEKLEDKVDERYTELHEALIARTEKMEDKFVLALEKLGDRFEDLAQSFREIAAEHSTQLAVHETRLNALEKGFE